MGEETYATEPLADEGAHVRKLTLRKDTLAELASDELARVAGAAATEICLTDPCVTRPVTGIWCLTRDWCAE